MMPESFSLLLCLLRGDLLASAKTRGGEGGDGART